MTGIVSNVADGLVLGQRTLVLRGVVALRAFVARVVGALSFRRFGYVATVPLAAVLLLLALVPVIDDVRWWGRAPSDRDGAA